MQMLLCRDGTGDPCLQVRLPVIQSFDTKLEARQEARGGIGHLLVEDNEIFACGAWNRSYDVFYGRGKDIDTADDEHVIGPPPDTAGEPGVCTATWAGALVANKDVPRPPAD